MSSCEEPGGPLPIPSTEVAAGAGADSPISEQNLECWRCGQRHAATEPKCPHCLAINRRSESLLPPVEPAAQRLLDQHQTETSLIRLVWLLAAMMLVSILTAIARAGGTIEPDESAAIALLLAVEGLDSGIVLWGLAKIPVPRLPQSAGQRWLLAWLAAPPLLGLLLALNVSYHQLLLLGLNKSHWALHTAGEGMPLFWHVLGTWLQPAIVEELFFRYLAIGLLSSIVRPPTAIVVSAVMFGMAHSGMPLSIPYLIVLGLVLGQLYYSSRNLALPMLMHLVHNAVVTWGEWS